MPTIDLALHPWQTYAACGGGDPRWWETPSSRDHNFAPARNGIDVCRTCRVKPECRAAAQDERPRGVIRAGTPYNDDGRPMPNCQVCYEPILVGDPRCRYCEKHDKYDLVRLGRKAAA